MITASSIYNESDPSTNDQRNLEDDSAENLQTCKNFDGFQCRGFHDFQESSVFPLVRDLVDSGGKAAIEQEDQPSLMRN